MADKKPAGDMSNGVLLRGSQEAYTASMRNQLMGGQSSNPVVAATEKQTKELQKTQQAESDKIVAAVERKPVEEAVVFDPLNIL
jgi:hypothetical protein